ncbi:MAG: hypothetical protein DMG69_15195 [Acidobacteria bacterium]|nr:MAG: hypothetical protein DMG69_15195 [Acidobacteriota bacterium]
MWQWSKQGEDAVIPFVLFNQAWTWYEKSVSRWMQIPNSSKISGNGQAATTDQKELGLRFGKSLQHFQPWPVTWSEPLVYEKSCCGCAVPLQRALVAYVAFLRLYIVLTTL